MKTTPVKGTNDYLPTDTALRDFVQSSILSVYRASGYNRITTPILEDIENLDKSEGGENLNLIFKVMKRGEKLEAALASGDSKELSDIGLRYDLTLPLCRYFANNRAFLPFPFKCIQTDRVYRAERPQKGRLREFVQCDIDVLGDESCECEVELIATTAKALRKVGFEEFTVKLNDRRILKAVLEKCGFESKNFDSACISLDKLDKIGAAGVRKELIEKGCPEDAVETLLALFKGQMTLEKAWEFVPDCEAAERLSKILNMSLRLAEKNYSVAFDLTLIRGQGYYTGTVFEVSVPGYPGAVAGGGRYDNLVGKFISESVPAVGFSIGFERIFGILKEKGFKAPEMRRKLAVIYEGEFLDGYTAAETLRENYDCSLFEKPKKIGKLLNNLEKNGFDGFVYANSPEDIRTFEKSCQQTAVSPEKERL